MFSSSRLSLIVRVALVAVAILFLWALFANDSGASGPAQRYTVMPGDTLWSIAATRYGGDPREGVWRIEHANGLRGGTIAVGQRLLLP
ncbi:MAG: LysM peptidoglycan-binding domain-containing protein [Gaiellales bacterium]